jgi:hypothetical protein
MKAEVGTQWAVRFEPEVGASSVQEQVVVRIPWALTRDLDHFGTTYQAGTVLSGAPYFTCQ